MVKQPQQIRDLPLKRADPDSPIPLYYQIEADLRHLIDTGVFVPGDVLPPEVELCKAYGVGRQTMRTALSRLAAEHLIERKAGRGTIVKSATLSTQFYLDRSFTRQMADMGLTAHSQILAATIGVIDAESPKALQVKIGSPCFYLARLRFGNDETIGLQYSTIITELCPSLAKHDFDRLSLYDVLSQEYSLIITEIAHVIGAVTATAKQAELLNVISGAPLLNVKTHVFIEGRQIIEFTNSYYRADKYEYRTTHTVD
jgi:GntR family transcriptional regulator